MATLLVRDEAAARWEREPPTGEIPENPPLEAQCQTPWKRPGALVEECLGDESAGLGFLGNGEARVTPDQIG